MESWRQFGDFAAQYTMNVVIAVAILVVGWIAAWLVAMVVRRALGRTDFHRRIVTDIGGKRAGEDIDLWVSRATFIVLMLFVLIAVFEALLLPSITQPLSEMLSIVLDYAPRFGGALLLLAGAWLVATVLHALLARGLGRLRIDERFGQATELPPERTPLADSIATTVYWLTLLLFLPAVLGVLGLEGLLGPVEGLVDEVLAYLPNVVVAALILAVGWVAARLVQRVVTRLLGSSGLDDFAERHGIGRALGQGYTASMAIGVVVHVLILLPVIVAALDALQLAAVTDPAAHVLDLVFTAIPALFAAALVLIIAYFVGRVASVLVAELLASVGFDRVLSHLGLETQEIPQTGGRTPSQVAGSLVLVAIMLFAAMEALNLLAFEQVADLVANVLVFFGQVLVGLVVIGVGIYLGNLAAATIRTSATAQAGRLARIAQIAIVALALAMGLQQMGLGEQIVGLAFGLLLGAAAIAAAIAFGLGGRDLAAEQLARWRDGNGKSGGSRTRSKRSASKSSPSKGE